MAAHVPPGAGVVAFVNETLDTSSGQLINVHYILKAGKQSAYNTLLFV